jgi:hypothetical protein
MATIRAKTGRKRRNRRPEFVVDERDRRVAVVLPIAEYKKLLEAAEDLEDIRAADAARAEGGEPIPWEEVKAELRGEGKLP